jgi:hypothetical protein
MGCYVGERRRGENVTYFFLVARCSIPTDRHILCPRPHRTYRAHEVTIADGLGQRILGISGSR